jgi:hypothetical protein
MFAFVTLSEAKGTMLKMVPFASLRVTEKESLHIATP